jgi:hypothetical protein
MTMSVLKKTARISEKMAMLNERHGLKFNQYAFRVDLDAESLRLRKK